MMTRAGTCHICVTCAQGLRLATQAGAEEVSVFAAASETFSRRNTNCSIAESMKRFEEVTAAAKEAGVRVRGYVSTAVGCPYEVGQCSQPGQDALRCQSRKQPTAI